MANERLLDFLSNIFTPGVQPEAVKILNGALIALLVWFLLMILLGKGNIHIFIMLSLAACLLVTVNWFLSEYYAIKNQQGRTLQVGTKKKSFKGNNSKRS